MSWKSYLFPSSHSYLREVFNLNGVEEGVGLEEEWGKIRRRWGQGEELDRAREEVGGVLCCYAVFFVLLCSLYVAMQNVFWFLCKYFFLCCYAIIVAMRMIWLL